MSFPKENELDLLNKFHAFLLLTVLDMERMFKDIAISSDIHAEFLSWYKPVVDLEHKPKVDFSPIIVSNGCWPSSVILRGTK